MHLLWVLCLHPARQGMWIYKPVQPCRCGTKEQVLWCIPWCVSPPSPLLVHAPRPCTYPPPQLLLCLHAVHLSRPPPISGRSCSIPAGPGLFISSEAAMINEALNTSSLSPGPGEPHSWVNKPSRCSTPLPWSWALGGLTGNPRPPPPTAGRNSRDLSGLLQRCSYQWTSRYITMPDSCKRSNTESSGRQWVKEKHPRVLTQEPWNVCGTHAHTLAPYGQAVYERNMLWLQIYYFLTCSLKRMQGERSIVAPGTCQEQSVSLTKKKKKKNP